MDTVNDYAEFLARKTGIGSEIYTAVRLGRRGLGIELKPSYWRTAVDNLRALDHDMDLPTLFDEVGA